MIFWILVRSKKEGGSKFMVFPSFKPGMVALPPRKSRKKVLWLPARLLEMGISMVTARFEIMEAPPESFPRKGGANTPLAPTGKQTREPTGTGVKSQPPNEFTCAAQAVGLSYWITQPSDLSSASFLA